MNPGPAWSPLWTELCSEAQSKEHNHGTERELRRSAGLLRNLEGMKPTSMVIQTSQRPVSSVFVFFSHATVFWSLFLANHAHHHRHPPLSELTPRSTSLSSSQPSLMYEGSLSPPLHLPPHTLHLPYLSLHTPSTSPTSLYPTPPAAAMKTAQFSSSGVWKRVETFTCQSC